jgi:hypothetical protein
MSYLTGKCSSVRQLVPEAEIARREDVNGRADLPAQTKRAQSSGIPAQDEPHTRLRYFCSPQHTDSALYPIISQLERAAQFERHDTPDVKLDKLTMLFGLSAGHQRDISFWLNFCRSRRVIATAR